MRNCWHKKTARRRVAIPNSFGIGISLPNLVWERHPQSVSGIIVPETQKHKKTAGRAVLIVLWQYVYLVTFPALRQLVQTFIVFGLPLTLAWTVCKFILNRLLVTLCAWLTLLPLRGFFPQISQTCAIGILQNFHQYTGFPEYGKRFNYVIIALSGCPDTSWLWI